MLILKNAKTIREDSLKMCMEKSSKHPANTRQAMEEVVAITAFHLENDRD